MTALRLPAGNPMTKALVTILVFEVITFGLAVPGMVLVDHVRTSTAVLAGGGAALLALVAAATLRHGWGWLLAWAAQLAGIALGLLTGWMWVMGGVFALLWTTSFVLGRRLPSSVGSRS